MSDLILRERSLVQVRPVVATLLAYGSLCLAGGARLHRFAD